LPVDAPVVVNVDHKLGWFGTLRGRLGATITPDWLGYVTGGVAVGGITIAGTVTDPIGNAVNTAFNNNLTRVGWTVGAGLETHLTGNWTGKVEYLHMDFGSIATVPTVAPNDTIATMFNSRVSDNIIRLGVNYKFDRGGGIVAKY
jgi:iron complex outermembrane receptor protein